MKLNLSVALMLSVLLNVLLTLGFAITRSTVEGMASGKSGDGTLKARVKSGSFGCSGHGIYDFLSEDCRCHECWTGGACDVQEGPETCRITAEGGDPLIFEEYWMWDGGSSSSSGGQRQQRPVVARSRDAGSRGDARGLPHRVPQRRRRELVRDGGARGRGPRHARHGGERGRGGARTPSCWARGPRSSSTRCSTG